MLLKCECNYKDTINYGIRWIVSYMRIFVERFIVVYAFYPKKKNRAHARLWNIKKSKMSRHTTSSFASFPSVLNSGGGNTSQDTMQNQSGSVAGI